MTDSFTEMRFKENGRSYDLKEAVRLRFSVEIDSENRIIHVNLKGKNVFNSKSYESFGAFIMGYKCAKGIGY